MKLGKQIENTMHLVECEGGMEVGGSKTVEELRADGYKDAILESKPDAECEENWEEFPDCWVQSWTTKENEEEEIDN